MVLPKSLLNNTEIAEDEPVTIQLVLGRGVQHYVIKFVSDLRQGRWFSPVSSTNKTNCHDITEILLKVALRL
jgi:hypothetical protein